MIYFISTNYLDKTKRMWYLTKEDEKEVRDEKINIYYYGFVSHG